MDKQAAWDYALGLIRIEDLSPSDDFMELVDQEIRNEITLDDMLVFLDQKYGLRR